MECFSLRLLRSSGELFGLFFVSSGRYPRFGRPFSYVCISEATSLVHVDTGHRQVAPIEQQLISFGLHETRMTRKTRMRTEVWMIFKKCSSEEQLGLVATRKERIDERLIFRLCLSNRWDWLSDGAWLHAPLLLLHTHAF